MRSIILNRKFITSLLFALCTYSIGVCAIGESDAAEEEVVKGPNGGRLLTQEDLSVELAIFERGVPPEYHAYLSNSSGPISPDQVDLNVILTRLGDVKDDIQFLPEDGFLRSNMTIYEPHSFQVSVYAAYQGKKYEWHYDNFEGRVTIKQDIANAMGIGTTNANSENLKETITAYGRVVSLPNSKHPIYARFPGIVRSVHVTLGETVKAGQTLLTIESNAGLKNYSVKAPISGVITALAARPQMVTYEQTLMTVTDNTRSVVELDIFPSKAPSVELGQAVRVSIDGVPKPLPGKITYIGSEIKRNQSIAAHVAIDSGASNSLIPGLFASADIEVGNYDVGLAVRKKALQAFRDFTVVYAKVGDTYEVRMLELGREAGPWVEVLGGLEKGIEYVSENSYIIKADIEKSGAAHDH